MSDDAVKQSEGTDNSDSIREKFEEFRRNRRRQSKTHLSICVMRILDKEGTLTKGDLARYLKLDPCSHTLSRVIRILRHHELVRTSGKKGKPEQFYIEPLPINYDPPTPFEEFLKLKKKAPKTIAEKIGKILPSAGK